MCRNFEEVLPADALESIGKYLVTISYHDDNLYHKMMAGRLVSGVPHFMNKTPIE